MNSLILLPILAVVFYLLLIRPQQRRASQQKQLLSALSVGEEVVTAGGVFGTVTDLDSERMWLEVAPGVTIVFLRQSLARRLTERGAPPAGTDPDDMVSEWDRGDPMTGPEPAVEAAPEAPVAQEPESSGDPEGSVGPGAGSPTDPASAGDPAAGPEGHQAPLGDSADAVGHPGTGERRLPEDQGGEPQPPTAPEEGKSAAPEEGKSAAPPGRATGERGTGGPATGGPAKPPPSDV